MKRSIHASMLLVLLLSLLSGCAKQTSVEVAEGHNAHQHHAAPNDDQHTNAVETMWHFSPAAPQAESSTKIQLMVTDPSGQAIDKFVLNHEKLLHLIVVSKDLSYFNHLHPDYKGKGIFEIANEFPAGGEYKLFADFKPEGYEAAVKDEIIRVIGKTDTKPIVPDTQLTQVLDQETVTLAADKLAAGQEVSLTFQIADTKTKQPVQDLQPYLGAIGHVVIIDAAAEQYLHVHPSDEKTTGPDAVFQTTFPKAGVYKIWGQFQRGGRPFTASFVVEVK